MPIHLSYLILGLFNAFKAEIEKEKAAARTNWAHVAFLEDYCEDLLPMATYADKALRGLAEARWDPERQAEHEEPVGDHGCAALVECMRPFGEA